MQFRVLAHDEDLRVRCDRRQIGQRRADAPRRFVPNRGRRRLQGRRAKRSRRAALVRGGKPSKAKRRSGKPESSATPIAALGPGSTSTATPAARAAATSSLPGSEIPGIPASLVTATSAIARPLENRRRRALRVLLAIAPDLARRRASSAPSSFRATRVSSATISSASRSTSSARSVTSRRFPSGVGTKTSGMARGFDVEHIPPGAKFELYISPSCPYCQRAMAHYDAAEPRTQRYDAQNDRNARKRMFAYSGGDPTVPVIVVDGSYVQSGWGSPPRG